MKRYTILVLGLVFILTFAGCSTRQGEIRPAPAPMITIDGNNYFTPYMPVDELPDGYEYIGDLPEEATNNTKLAGCKMYAIKELDSYPDFYLYQECGTPVSEDTVDNTLRQWAYVQWICSEISETAKIKLTIEKIIELSEKGEALTWGDFEQYENSGDIGSGLYVIRYDMEEPYYVLVGGADTETIPMYIRLVSTQNTDNYIDIRTESIDDFLAENYNQEWKIESGDVDTNMSSPLDGVTMEVTKCSDISVTVKIVNDTEKYIQCGDAFYLEVQDEESVEWRKLDTIIDNAAFDAIAHIIQKDSPYEMVIDFEWLYGKLEPGRYRIVKTITGFRGSGDYTDYIYTAEFTVN